MIPSANSEKRDSAEPEKVLRSPKMPFARPPLLKKFEIWSALMPGAGSHDPSR